MGIQLFNRVASWLILLDQMAQILIVNQVILRGCVGQKNASTVIQMCLSQCKLMRKVFLGHIVCCLLHFKKLYFLFPIHGHINCVCVVYVIQMDEIIFLFWTVKSQTCYPTLCRQWQSKGGIPLGRYTTFEEYSYVLRGCEKRRHKKRRWRSHLQNLMTGCG